VARNWDEWLKTASGPASPTEEQDRDRTEARIRRAVERAADLPTSVGVYAKGSYANGTNVRRDSDVDIAVEWTDTAYVQRALAAKDLSPSELGYEPVDIGITPQQFRERVERAVINAFGSSVVDTSGDKAIHVVRGENSLDADVVPCFGMHRYDEPRRFHRGHRIFRKDTRYVDWVDNFPAQNKANATTKNSATSRRYKEIVRCLKRIEGELADEKKIAREYPGYLVECLLYNVPDGKYGHPRRYDDLDAALVWLWEALGDEDRVAQLVEVNDLVYLFRGRTDRIPANARELVNMAWNRLHDNI
jgi:predicted nucleotidyltransferase